MNCGFCPEQIEFHENDPWTEGRYGIAYIDQEGAMVTSNTTGVGLTANESTINYVA